MKRIGILTGGGDVPGLNPCIKAVVFRATDAGCEVLGIRRGWGGLLNLNPSDPESAAQWVVPLTKANTRTIDRSGGTFLHTSRTNPSKVKPREVPEFLRDPERVGPESRVLDFTPHVLKNVEFLGIARLIPIGGDDTLGNTAYKHAGIGDPLRELDFIELHDAYTSSEVQTYEDLGLCRYGEGGAFAASGKAFMPNIDYGLPLPDRPVCPVNPSGGLIACGHPVGATGLMQAVFAVWQLQGTIAQHFGDGTLQIKDARRGAIHSHAGTGTYVTVSVLERE